MIGIILGGVIGVATIVYLSFQKPQPESEKSNIQQSDDGRSNKSNEKEQSTEVAPTLTKEQQEVIEKEQKRQQIEANKRRERLLQGLSEQDRKIFEGYISEVTTEGDQKSSSSDPIIVEILLIGAGLLLVYALIAIVSDRFYSPFDIFNILKMYLIGDNSDSLPSSQANDSPFASAQANEL